jgi:hypothetical protein
VAEPVAAEPDVQSTRYWVTSFWMSSIASLERRPVLPPSVSRPNQARLRSAARCLLRVKLGSLTYANIVRLLVEPAAYEGVPILPAAIVNHTHRVRQARILGLQRKSEEERQVKAQKQETRTISKGAALNTEARIAARKVFYTYNAPTRKFRLGDKHEPPHGPAGRCVGHHLWRYDDGSYVRKGVKLPARSSTD